ncbi:3-oxosteroid 1-dehydrogenase [Cryptosporangium aurantiacum]|uniref:3-oxosteroid 1-dehydrogenase n=1 Tax=Cryptosporangium aurantiacum TaxID=134849 RepID=A0A1M7K5T1_9ACTN|nr:3-oxosteroid 1-dehydrogenase [Cryptosporangium aurantiacum]SHM60564.1 3-oxosteroid 1-dehydrogenase [Cryptosporangium aurantiacum]
MSAAQKFDLVVVGAGGAGMAAALTAAASGLRAIVVEKAPRYGGSTARSGGGVWIPNNQALERDGVVDDAEAARTYLAHIVATASRSGDTDVSALQAAFLRHGPDMLAFVEKETPLRFGWVRDYSDYYPEAPGGRPTGRSVEPKPLPSSVLGGLRSTLEPPYLASKSGLAITQAEFRWLNLVARHPRGVATAAKVGARAWISRARRRELLTMGQALAAGLRAGLARRDVPVWLSTPLLELVVKDGRVIGVEVAVRGGEPEQLLAERGVVLTAGGFERDDTLRKRYQKEPIGTEWTVGAEANTGDGIRAAQDLGAAVRLMDDAWWGPSVPLPRGPYFLLAERSLPGCVLVDVDGSRFVNEAAPYVDAVHAMYEAGEPRIPAWLVFDQRYRDRYLFTARGPRQPLPGSWYRAGVAAKSSTLAGLAEKIGVPAEALEQTVARFNGFASTGKDLDFGRGESAYDRYYGDPRVKPNPCLAELVKPPFHAVKIVPGDLGTKGGLVTDERSRVLREDGSVIPGLYAAGNTSAQVMGRTYAGPGATLGPAMTSGYLAALDAAGAL